MVTHLETVLERDLRLILNTRLGFDKLYGVLEALAFEQGDILDHTLVSKKNGISRATLNLLLRAFESLYLIRQVRVFGGRKNSVLYFEDQGLRSFLMKSEVDRHFHRNLFYSNLIPQFHYRPEIMSTLQHYQTRGGATVDFVFKGRKTQIAYIANPEATPTRSAIVNATRFKKKYPQTTLFIGRSGKICEEIAKETYAVPFKSIF